MKWVLSALLGCVLAASSAAAAPSVTDREMKVFPPEFKDVKDPVTGAQLRFITTATSKDDNLYFHQRSWFSDGSVILFVSDRADGGIMGYIAATGELVAFEPELRNVCATAGGGKPCVFFLRKGGIVVEATLDIKPSADPAKKPSNVIAHERIICTLPAATGEFEISESCDNKTLAVGNTAWTHMKGAGIVLIDEDSGENRDLCAIDPDLHYGGHLQWSITDPHKLSFAAIKSRLWMVDTRDGKPVNIYHEWPGELVTHEAWWVNDTMLFCGGTHPMPTQDPSVKLLDPKTGVVRIVGAGAWWEGATAEQLAKVNWWHSDGSDDGRWVVADNWYGDIRLWEGTTTRPRPLTYGHRTYGKGDHPHVGFDRAGKQVIFTSMMLGDANVCIATIPQEWQDANPAPAAK
jgi:oligogalacturonide lyase